MKKAILVLAILLSGLYSYAQYLGYPPEYIKALTPLWKGERSADGRPKVSDADLKHLESCTIEQLWKYLYDKGFHNQVTYDWMIVKTGSTMVGRVVTAQFMPARPDLDSLVKKLGIAEGRSQSGGNNTWPIDVLTKGDVYVADGFGKRRDGTLIGSSLGNAIYGKTGKGVIFYGTIRDVQELKETEGFNAWTKGQDASFIKDMTPTSINAPIRIDEATVFPGDVVFANDYGVVFIPAYLVTEILTASDIITLRDEFEREMAQTGKYLTGQVHGKWDDNMKGEFRNWFNKHKKTTVSIKDIDDYLAKLPK